VVHCFEVDPRLLNGVPFGVVKDIERKEVFCEQHSKVGNLELGYLAATSFDLS
jgi:hypothetical protein